MLYDSTWEFYSNFTASVVKPIYENEKQNICKGDHKQERPNRKHGGIELQESAVRIRKHTV
jgi:hypothetical protein